MKKIIIEGFENSKIIYDIPEDSEFYLYSANSVEEPIKFLLTIEIRGEGKLEDYVMEEINCATINN